MRLIFAVLFALFLTGQIRAQLPSEVFTKSQQIRFLDSSRSDVRKLFAKYESDLDDEDNSDTFQAPGLEVEVWYASGECSESAGSNTFPDVWNVKNGKVIKVAIRFEHPVAIAEFTLYTSLLIREQSDEESPDNYVEFSKARGIMFDIVESGVERIVLFPPSSKSRFLCHDNTWGKGFYSSKAWADEFNLDIVCVLKNLPAHVDDLKLSATQVEATLDRTISIETTASDPENDVLIYIYSVSAGQIRGAGSKVIWDLNGVSSGTYTITAGVDDGSGIMGRTITKTITVR